MDTLNTTARPCGSPLAITYRPIGDLIPYERLATFNDRQAFMDHLKDLTYALGENMPRAPKDRIKRPRKAPREQVSL